jgi:hypothetical protein
VAELAKTLGGGGHAAAAGFPWAGSLDELVDALVDAAVRDDVPVRDDDDDDDSRAAEMSDEAFEQALDALSE